MKLDFQICFGWLVVLTESQWRKNHLHFCWLKIHFKFKQKKWMQGEKKMQTNLVFSLSLELPGIQIFVE